MNIGLYDVDSSNFPNLPLMKISAYHKSLGDSVEFINRDKHYDKVYVSKVLGDEYSTIDLTIIDADEVEFGGTGFAITVDESGKEIYNKAKDKELPYEIEHIYPDYSLYPEFTEDTAYGFLTRGCCNNCDFCIVSQKEGTCSHKVANLSEWWSGQKYIKLLDPNILACKDRINLLGQLRDSGAWVDFTQGLDARFITEEVAVALKGIKTKMWHFAFDLMKSEKQIINGLKLFKEVVKPGKRKCYVYVLTNYNTTIAEDMYRIKKLKDIGIDCDIRIYRKNSLPRPHILRDLQRWCNSKIIYYANPNFWEYVPRRDGLPTKVIYKDIYEDILNKEEL